MPAMSGLGLVGINASRWLLDFEKFYYLVPSSFSATFNFPIGITLTPLRI